VTFSVESSCHLLLPV